MGTEIGNRRRGAWGLIVVLALVAMTVSSCGLVDDDDEDSDKEVSTLTDTAKVPSGERRVTVSLTVDLTDGAKVTANVTSKPRPAGVLVKGVQMSANDDQFTIVLNRPAPTKGVLVTFLKVSALITIAAIALVGVMLATEEESKNLGALFGLLGAIAGYLAGNKPTSEDDSEVELAPPGAPGAPGAPGSLL